MEKVRSAPEQVVAHTQLKKRDAGIGKNEEVAGWWRRLRINKNLRIRKKWCSGEASAWRVFT